MPPATQLSPLQIRDKIWDTSDAIAKAPTGPNVMVLLDQMYDLLAQAEVIIDNHEGMTKEAKYELQRTIDSIVERGYLHAVLNNANVTVNKPKKLIKI